MLILSSTASKHSQHFSQGLAQGVGLPPVALGQSRGNSKSHHTERYALDSAAAEDSSVGNINQKLTPLYLQLLPHL